MLIGANCANYKKNSISVRRNIFKAFFIKKNKLTNTKCNLKYKIFKQIHKQTNINIQTTLLMHKLIYEFKLMKKITNKQSKKM